jgi:hypothetical protein
VAGEVLGLLADHLAEPAADFRRVDRVVIDPLLVPRVVRRVNVDALHLAGVVGEEGLEGQEVVAFDQEVAASGIADGELRVAAQEMIRNLAMVVEDSLLADPVQRRHGDRL